MPPGVPAGAAEQGLGHLRPEGHWHGRLSTARARVWDGRPGRCCTHLGAGIHSWDKVTVLKGQVMGALDLLWELRSPNQGARHVSAQ